jgi:glycosidase
MSTASVFGTQANQVIAQAKADALARKTVPVGGATIRTPFPSPEDWRDELIYFLLVDRFNNPNQAPLQPDPCLPYQGGNFEGIRQQLGYLQGLGTGAIWVSPVLMNPQKFPDYYGGYATQDFLRIEPRFCKNPAQALAQPQLADQEFRQLVDEIHAKGMYVILDIVLNHGGDLFNYEGMRDVAPWKGDGPEYNVFWRDGNNVAQGAWTDIAQVANLPRDAGVWPQELQRNDYFRRRGDVAQSPDQTRGDFSRLKELVTEYMRPADGSYPVRDILIRAYQYLIAKFDIDGFRVDTLMYVERDFARSFANAMREFALSIGKKNFFTFGEVWLDDDEARIAEYVGRDTVSDDVGIIGADATLDFPLRKRLEGVCKGVMAPAELALHMDYRREVQKTVLSSHGDVGAYFVTFAENHDLPYRYAASCQPEQVTLAIACLLTLQGVPSVYYGMEQGMSAAGNSRESARECLWRNPAVFAQNPQHVNYQAIAQMSALRASNPALRYGRQYFRQLTGNNVDFGYSPSPGGVLSYSRVLNDREVVVLANTSQTQPATVNVVVDRQLHQLGDVLSVLFSNLPLHGAAPATPPGVVFLASGRSVVTVALRPMEALVLA